MSRAHREETHAEALIRKRKVLPSGPWQNEPDALDWTHEGISCQLRRNDVGFNWCGYARVPDGHPWFSLHHEALYGVSLLGFLTHTLTGALEGTSR